MKNKKKLFRSYRENCVKTVKDLIIAIALCLIMFAGLLAALPIIAYADEPEYSGVLEDLQKDAAFDVSEYDNVLKHPKTELIQISESKSNELFLYVHFVGDIKPLSLVVFNVETTYSKVDFNSYPIVVVSTYNNFVKYKVNDYIARSGTHIYAITRFDYPVDRPLQGTQEQTYEYIPVEQLWTVNRFDSGTTYFQEHLETLTVTDKIVKSHNDGESDFWGYTSWTDTFYIAFSTDIDMDALVEAQIEYRLGKQVNVGDYDVWKPNDDAKPINVVINADQTAEFKDSIKDHWWFFEWNIGVNHRKFQAISTPKEFIENSGISVPKDKFGNDFDWVVIFYNETKYFDKPVVIPTYDIPADTSILRLKYIKDGVCYNLGVLDTRTSYIPPKLQTQSYWWILWLVLGILIVVLCLCFISPLTTVLSGVLKGLFTLLTWLFKAIIWVISLPIRLIAALFGGGK